MTEKRKRPSGSRPSSAQLLKALESPKLATRERVIDQSRKSAPRAGQVLAALLRGLNDEDEAVRLEAAKGIMDAFPNAEGQFSHPLMNEIVESDEPKVRLAAIRSIIILLPNVLAALSGFKPDELSTTGRQPDPVMEDLMEHAGRWIAWTRDRKQILAVADSFTDVMAMAEAVGESDPYVKKAPGVSPNAERKPFELLEGESRNILDDIRKVIPQPEAWLDAPNELLGGDKPRNLIDTEREREVRYLLRGIEDGITT
jgi:hypothetical protein